MKVHYPSIAQSRTLSLDRPHSQSQRDSFATDSFRRSSADESISVHEHIKRIQQAPSPGVSRKEIPDAYQQTEPKWSDPKGDATLIRMLDKAPESIVGGVWNYLFKGEKWHDHGGETSKIHTSAKSPLFTAEQVTKEFEAVIDKYPDKKPHVGPEHTWSPEAEEYKGLGFWRRLGAALRGQQDFPSPTIGSKLILMLGLGQTSRFAITGQEEELTTNLMSYDDGSVDLKDMFEESYKLHGGDLYQTLLCAENILAYDVNDPDREYQPLQEKLKYIRDDEPQVGDNFGAWYHFFGTALYGVVRSEWKVKGIAATESLGSLFMEGKDPQEDYVNWAGAEVGARLKDSYG